MKNQDTTIHAVEALERAQWIAFAPFVFQAACVLRDRGILAALEESARGLSTRQVASAVGLSEYATRVLLEAGLGIGLIVECEGRHRLTKTGVFVLHDAMTRTNMNFTRDVAYEPLARLGEAAATGKPVGLERFGSWATLYEGLSHLPEAASRSWFAFDHHYSDGAFSAALTRVLSRGPRRLLDLGANTGKWALACLARDPTLEITLVDLPGQLEVAAQNVAAADRDGRVSLRAMDVLDEACELPRGFDAIWMSQFLDCFSEAQIVSILSRCVPALDAGGRIYILEPFWDRQRFPAASFCLQMTSLYFTAIANGNSQMYRSETLLECVRAAGLRVEEEHDGLGVGHTLLVCHA